MLRILIPSVERYDANKNLFFSTKEQVLQLEHSLVSLSKWESKWKKPFLTKEPMTPEESIDYIKCMTLTQNVDPDVYNCIDHKIMETINNYIEDSMTATWFSEETNKKGGGNKETVTAEIIYYWMITLNIPFECQKWHLNRLLTLIKVCNLKNMPTKKMSKKDVLNRHRALNKARRDAMSNKR